LGHSIEEQPAHAADQASDGSAAESHSVGHDSLEVHTLDGSAADEAKQNWKIQSATALKS
jgi:hypothetical protein